MAKVTEIRARAADGEIIHFKRVIPQTEYRTQDGPGVMDGVPYLITDDGERLNYLGDDRYQMVSTGKVYERIKT